MGHIGEIGKRVTVAVTYKKSFSFVDYKYSYYGTTNYTHIFEDGEGNTIVWKSTNPVEYVNDGSENPNRKGDLEFIPEGSAVELAGTVKEHGMYKDTEQTVVTRCKFKLVERAKTKRELDAQKAEEQMASITDGDEIWEMPYSQYKEHYADCETVIGSYNDHCDTHGSCRSRPTIKVIIREGRLKASGVRGKHFKGWEFTSPEGKITCYRAVSEENARKQMMKDFPNAAEWKCTRIYDHRNYYRPY
jgi:hypothetical protein